MASEESIRRYRRWYAALVRLYPKPYHSRFGEGMEQTFNDLLRERAEQERGLLGYVLWVFVETSSEMMRENMTMIIVRRKSIICIALGTALILMIPFVAMQLTDEVNWDETDFIVMGALLFGTGLSYDLLARRVETKQGRVVLGAVLLAALLVVWADLAVGIFNVPGISES